MNTVTAIKVVVTDILCKGEKNMLREISKTELLSNYSSIVVKAAIEYVERKENNGYKCTLKEKVTKSGVYINIYVYDKTSWRYLLEKVLIVE